jgi:preprotein translocase subunit YajC
MLEALEKGDKVVTAGGMIVTIESFKNEGKSVIVRIDQNTRAENSAAKHNPGSAQ